MTAAAFFILVAVGIWIGWYAALYLVSIGGRKR
jgi:hypothetical protein